MDAGNALIVPDVIANVDLLVDVPVDMNDGVPTLFRNVTFDPVVVLHIASQYHSLPVRVVDVMLTVTALLEAGDAMVALTTLLVGRLFESVSYIPSSSGFVVPPFLIQSFPMVVSDVNSKGANCISSLTTPTLWLWLSALNGGRAAVWTYGYAVGDNPLMSPYWGNALPPPALAHTVAPLGPPDVRT